MTIDQFLAELDKLRVHKASTIGSALKKPLLILLLISRFERALVSENVFRFEEFEEDLTTLILSFGGRPSTSGAKPEQPFYHLQTSGFWHLVSSGWVSDSEGFSATIPTSILRDSTTYAYLETDIYQTLLNSSEARARAANRLLARWWPETIQSELRSYLCLPNVIARPRRASSFCSDVLANYRYRCAVCGFDAMLNTRPFGLDAGHIRWYSFNGPDTIENGLALCKLHHWALDRGAVTVDPDSLLLRVSPSLCSRDPHSIDLLESIEGRQLLEPRVQSPSPLHFAWHRDNVFISR